MNDHPKWVYPRLGRAGLGNELFPWFRAMDLAEQMGAELVAPRWLQPRIGPLLRRDRDLRQYWRLFKPVEPSMQLRRLLVESSLLIHRNSAIMVVSGMGRYFADLSQAHEVYRSRLRNAAREGVIVPRQGEYVSVHVRLGDFGPATDEPGLVPSHNTRTHMDWYTGAISWLHESWPDVPVVLSSDGRSEELAALLRLKGVFRSTAQNALDELFLMAGAVGLIGSRSTFSAWGAFLGGVPMILPIGGNAYAPHSDVWEAKEPSEAGEWLMAVTRRDARH